MIKQLIDHHIEKQNPNRNPTIQITNLDQKYRGIVYVNGLSENIRKIICENVRDVSVAFKSGKTVRNIFTKTKTPLEND